MQEKCVWVLPRKGLRGTMRRLFKESRMKEIPLTRGMVALVDDEDYDWLNQWRWYSDGKGRIYYAIRNRYEPHAGHRPIHMRMHRMVLEAMLGRRLLSHERPDHLNGNGLDNRRNNLRLANAAQNAMNVNSVDPHKTSRYKGVSRTISRHSPWAACIRSNGKTIHLGHHTTDVAAARAYDAKAKEIFGEFARLNFPNQA